MGVAILFTTEFGVLDAASRISTDIVKVAWLRDNPRWSEGRLYFAFLWGEIAAGLRHPAARAIRHRTRGAGAVQVHRGDERRRDVPLRLALVYINRCRLPAGHSHPQLAAGHPDCHRPLLRLLLGLGGV